MCMLYVPGKPMATLTWIICEGTWQGSGHTDLDYNYGKVLPGKAVVILTWIIYIIM